MKLDKAYRRDKKRYKYTYGMKVDSKPIITPVDYHKLLKTNRRKNDNRR